MNGGEGGGVGGAPPRRRCPACETDVGRSLGLKEGFDVHRCRSCGSVFVDPLPPAEAGLDYDGYYHEGNLIVPEFVDRRLAEMVAELEPFALTSRWIDIGCGAGSLLRAVARAGWRVQGTEIAPQPVQMLRAEGYDVLLGDAAELELELGAYDVVSLIEVIEHVPDPRALMRRAAALLRPGGVLFMTTPHASGISGRVLGLQWSAVSPPEHLQLFSRRGMSVALAASGFPRSIIGSRGVNPYELVRGLRTRAGSGEPTMTATERVQSAYRLNEALVGNSLGARAKAGANFVLTHAGLGDSLNCRAIRT